MSSTNKTTNLELSQFIGSDSPKWLTDYNADMEKIDSGYQTVKAQADATDLIVGGHTTSITTIQDTVSDQGTAITGLRTSVNGNTGSINTINELLGNGTPTTTDHTIIGAINEINANVGSLSSLSTSINTINELLGNGTPTTTDHTIIGAINEINANVGSLSSLSTTDKTSIVAAINEVTSSISNNEIVIISASVTGSEQAITLPTGYDYTTACVVFTNYSTGQRVFSSNGTNDSTYPTAYLHSNGNAVINANSSSGTTVYIGLIKHS